MIAEFYGCKSKSSVEAEKPSPVYIGDNARNNLEWAGTYIGLLPCADCPGIETRLTLDKKGAYTLIEKYIGHDDTPFETKGTFQWSALGNTVTLTDARSKEVSHYAVAEGQLTKLDNESNVITGEHAADYILAQVNPLLTGKKWKLAELNGKPVENSQAFLLLDAAGKTSGNLGCNTFTGTYILKIGNRIRFSKLAATLKMCVNMETENNLKKVFEVADSYSVSDSELILNRARMAPLAKFVPEK
jgi:heat shock protein HslJ